MSGGVGGGRGNPPADPIGHCLLRRLTHDWVLSDHNVVGIYDRDAYRRHAVVLHWGVDDVVLCRPVAVWATICVGVSRMSKSRKHVGTGHSQRDAGVGLLHSLAEL